MDREIHVATEPDGRVHVGVYLDTLQTREHSLSICELPEPFMIKESREGDAIHLRNYSSREIYKTTEKCNCALTIVEYCDGRLHAARKWHWKWKVFQRSAFKVR